MTSTNKFENMASNYYEYLRDMSETDKQIVNDYAHVAQAHYAYNDAKMAETSVLYIRNITHTIYDETYDKIPHYQMLDKRVNDLTANANTWKDAYEKALRRVEQHGVDDDEITGLLHAAWYDYAHNTIGMEIAQDDYQYDIYVMHNVYMLDPVCIAFFAHAFYSQHHTIKRLQQSMDRLRKMQASLDHVCKGVNDTMLYVQLFTSAYNNVKAIHTGIMSDVSDCESIRQHVRFQQFVAREKDIDTLPFTCVAIVLDQYLSQWHRNKSDVDFCMSQADALHRLAQARLRKAQELAGE